jgi:hypothetical protein
LDAKFPCPSNVEQGKLGNASVFPSAKIAGNEIWRPGQKEAYRKIAGKGAREPEAVSPSDVEEEDIDC